MTLAWMIFGALVSLVIVVGAEAAASAARVVAKPTRWIWGASLGAALVLVLAAPQREHASAISLAGLTVAPQGNSYALVASRTPDVAAQIAANVSASLRVVLRATTRLIPASADRYVGLAWLIVSATLMLLLAAVYVRMRIARRSWPALELHGVAVRLSDDAGPAVIGLMRPEIVVPRWLLTRNATEQRMALAHEGEHVRQRDHLLLAAGCVAVVLMPWNPAAWWMFSRLRLAIELDCDARVLKQGAEPLLYGSLLIDLAEQSFGLRMSAPALVDGSSHLQTRVMAMKTQTHKFARVRGSLVGLAAVSLFLVACEAKLPTSAEIQQMDVASAEKAMTLATATEQGANLQYRIDGVSATSDQAHALRSDQIASVDVSLATGGGAGKIIDIRTIYAPRRAMMQRDTSAAAGKFREVQRYAASVLKPDGDTSRSRMKVRDDKMQEFQGLLVIDGAIADPSRFKTLNPKAIASINVLKGEAAMAEYKDPRAANGVIDIKTKKVAP
jgi:beta-lactamase regulating signal transducer with metallopeptidase domain